MEQRLLNQPDRKDYSAIIVGKRHIHIYAVLYDECPGGCSCWANPADKPKEDEEGEQGKEVEKGLVLISFNFIAENFDF